MSFCIFRFFLGLPEWIGTGMHDFESGIEVYVAANFDQVLLLTNIGADSLSSGSVKAR